MVLIFNKLDKYAKKLESVENTKKELEIVKNNKLAIMFLNYNSGGYLGQPVINDGEVFGKKFAKYGYSCFYICNSKASEAMQILEEFISQKGKEIIFFYSGHGTSIKDHNNDESDGKDEAFVFRATYLKDDDFANIVNKYMVCDKFIAICDCCHSGTIYDIDSIDKDKLKHMVCISSCQDSQVSLQLEKNGLFTAMFWQCYNETTKTLNVAMLNKYLNNFNQKITFYSSNGKCEF